MKTTPPQKTAASSLPASEPSGKHLPVEPLLHPDTNPPQKLHGDSAPPDKERWLKPGHRVEPVLHPDTNPPEKLHGDVAAPVVETPLPVEPALHADTDPAQKLHGDVAAPVVETPGQLAQPDKNFLGARLLKFLKLRRDTVPPQKLKGFGAPLTQRPTTPLAQSTTTPPAQSPIGETGKAQPNSTAQKEEKDTPLQETFDQIYKRFLTINFGGKAGPEMPKADALTAAVSEASPFLPISYIEKYADHLKSRLPRLITLESAKEIEEAMLETVSGVVYQHRTKPAASLSRFLAVVSNFYRSFLADEKRARIQVKLTSVLPPLAMFQHDGGNGPFTVTVDDVKRLTDAEISVVSLPGTYAEEPILWAALAHEVGGHDVTHADSGLLDELARAVPGAFAGVAIPAGVSREQLNQLWSYWIDEASADVYGILNLGPALTICQAAYFAALLDARRGGAAKLSMASGFQEDDPMKTLDDHPTQILRLHLAIGVIQTLSKLTPEIRNFYVEFIESLAQSMSNGGTVVINGNIPLERDHSETISLTVPLSVMQQVARSVGGFIATTTLSALGGHSIQDIETWDDSDEERSTSVMAALLRDESIALLGDDAHLLAGSILTLLVDPGRYNFVTEKLNEGLDLSFKRDPIWGKPQRNPMLFRFGSYFESTSDPQPPPAAESIESISATAKRVSPREA